MRITKKVASTVVIGSMLVSMVGCGNGVHYIEQNDFMRILEDELGFGEGKDMMAYYDAKYYVIRGANKTAIFRAYWYDDERDAYKDFSEWYEEVEEAIEAGDFEGEYQLDFQDSSGFILLDGVFDGDDYTYGGYYFCDDLVVDVYTVKDSDKARNGVDEFVEAMGFPVL